MSEAAVPRRVRAKGERVGGVPKTKQVRAVHKKGLSGGGGDLRGKTGGVIATGATTQKAPGGVGEGGTSVTCTVSLAGVGSGGGGHCETSGGGNVLRFDKKKKREKGPGPAGKEVVVGEGASTGAAGSRGGVWGEWVQQEVKRFLVPRSGALRGQTGERKGAGNWFECRSQGAKRYG